MAASSNDGTSTMQILQYPAIKGINCQARFRKTSRRGWRMSEVARELAGLTGLLGWLGVLFYLTALGAARIT